MMWRKQKIHIHEEIDGGSLHSMIATINFQTCSTPGSKHAAPLTVCIDLTSWSSCEKKGLVLEYISE
jgi:hypothetical protein